MRRGGKGPWSGGREEERGVKGGEELLPWGGGRKGKEWKGERGEWRSICGTKETKQMEGCRYSTFSTYDRSNEGLVTEGFIRVLSV